jgi:uncharacterized repeat protein (TIGR03803 family)
MKVSSTILVLLLAAVSTRGATITLEAESGTLGSNWIVSNNVTPAFITITSDNATNMPMSATRVASYAVAFPEAGTYQLYARLRIGPGTFSDDSLFYGNGFGTKSPTLNTDWIFVNGLASVGFSNSTDVVTGGGSLGSGMWKWINLSQFTSQSGFTVSAGNLTQTFQIGARETGLDLDKLAFGTAGTSFTVAQLDNSGQLINTNLFLGPDGIAIHRFSAIPLGLNLDGANPAAGLALAGDALIGTTLNGGSSGAGTAFAMSLDGTQFTTLRSFTDAPDAGAPQSGLTFIGDRFFSATLSGGVNGSGAVIVGQTNGSVALLRSFAPISADNATNSGGASPSAALVLSDIMLFGSAGAGGMTGNGTLFSLTTNGATFSVLHHFSTLDSQTGTNADGAAPAGGLIQSGETLYGTASSGGARGNGVVFSIGTNGANFTVLHDFSPVDALNGTNSDGALPMAGLVSSEGKLYGTTFAGGSGGRGTVFSLQIDGTGFNVLHHFATLDAITRTNTGGASPAAALLLSSNVLYGTASAGGAGAAGTVFSLTPNGDRFDVIHSFTPITSSGTNFDGAFPVVPVLRVDNSIFGTTFGGGPGAAGTVFRVPLLPTPALITNVALNLDNTVTLSFLGGPNSTNIIQSTTQLTPPVVWQNIATNVADAGGAWHFIDDNDTATRYYRSYAH